MSDSLHAAVESLTRQLAWRGPNDRAQGVLTLTRFEALAVVIRLEAEVRVDHEPEA